MDELKKDAIIVKEKEGKFISMVGDTYRIVISGEQTAGSFAVIDMLIPPGGGPGPHSHAAFHESYFVVEGEIDFKTEHGNHTAKQGAFVTIPTGGLVHAFTNNSKTVARMLCTVNPSGLEAFFEEAGKPVEAGTFSPPPKMDEAEKERLKTLAEKYGQKLYPPDYLD